MNKKLGFSTLLLSMSAVLTGCSGLGLGESDYSCKGMPTGVTCMSAEEVYQATNNGQKISAPLRNNEKTEEGVSSLFGNSGHSEVVRSTGIPANAASDTVVDTYVVPNLPDSPIPIRTPAQVMRIWVAPWEDSNGDFVAASEIYTDIEPRKWVLTGK